MSFSLLYICELTVLCIYFDAFVVFSLFISLFLCLVVEKLEGKFGQSNIVQRGLIFLGFVAQPNGVTCMHLVYEGTLLGEMLK